MGKKIEGYDKLCDQMDTFVDIQEKRNAKIIQRLKDWDTDFKKIQLQYERNKRYNENMAEHMKQRKKNIRKGKASMINQ